MVMLARLKLVPWWKIAQTIVAIVVIWFGSGGLGTLGSIDTTVKSLQAQVVTLQQANESLQAAVEALRELAQAQEKEIQFLKDCLTRPLPWPGSSLCPKPQAKP